mmetsp:Transcript_22464/g.76955  ORF Transcript_22464/g.76955 Transcript_22464/m.76955 type:complete len:207 (-) Transcript_22464:1539-2159(-)
MDLHLVPRQCADLHTALARLLGRDQELRGHLDVVAEKMALALRRALDEDLHRPRSESEAMPATTECAIEHHPRARRRHPRLEPDRRKAWVRLDDAGEDHGAGSVFRQALVEVLAVAQLAVHAVEQLAHELGHLRLPGAQRLPLRDLVESEEPHDPLEARRLSVAHHLDVRPVPLGAPGRAVLLLDLGEGREVADALLGGAGDLSRA